MNCSLFHHKSVRPSVGPKRLSILLSVSYFQVWLFRIFYSFLWRWRRFYSWGEREREYNRVWVSLCTLVLWWILIYDFVSRPPINQVVNRLLWNKFLRDLVYGRVWDASICYRFPASQDVGVRERERKSEKEQNELRHQLILFAVICFISLCHNSIFCLYFISHRKRKRLAIFIMFKIHSEASKNAQPRF